MIRTNIHLTEKQLEALRKLSEDTGLTVAEHIRRTIDEYLERKRKANEDEHPEEILEEVDH